MTEKRTTAGPSVELPGRIGRPSAFLGLARTRSSSGQDLPRRLASLGAAETAPLEPSALAARTRGLVEPDRAWLPNGDDGLSMREVAIVQLPMIRRLADAPRDLEEAVNRLLGPNHAAA